jgi:hypothetical protein
MDAPIEWRIAAFDGIRRQRAGNQRRFQIRFRRKQIDQRQRGRDLRAVQKREAFLRFEFERMETGAGERRARRHGFAAEARMPFADQHGRKMGQRREIARRAHGTLLGNFRQHACVEQFEQALDHHAAHARISARKARHLERQHEPHDGIGQCCADAGGMRQHKIALQRLEIARRDARLRELAEARVDAVNRATRCERILDERARTLDAGPRAIGQRHRAFAFRDPAPQRQRRLAGDDFELAHQLRLPRWALLFVSRAIRRKGRSIPTS